MAKPERLDENTMVAEDKRTLARALKQARKKRGKAPATVKLPTSSSK